MEKHIFINWSNEGGQNNIDLFQTDDLPDYKLAFFNPLNFALQHKLRQNGQDVSISEYIRFDKDDFMRFMANIKNATKRLKTFLGTDGVLVVRSNMPNSYIQVRRYASQGTQKFTESVLPAFFWLEEFIGKFSFLYRYCNTLEFLDCNNALYRNFTGLPVACWQSHDIIPKGETTVLARCGSYSPFPILTRISLNPEPGEIYFIPEFKVNNENDLLVKAFEEVIFELKSGLLKPAWLYKYEKELEINNPFSVELDEINQKLEMYNKRKAALDNRFNMMKNLTRLLYRTGDDLSLAVREAMEFMGFECRIKLKSYEPIHNAFYATVDNLTPAIVQVASAETGPVTMEIFDRIKSEIDFTKYDRIPKLILVVNADYTNPPDIRTEPYTDELFDAAKEYGYAIISTMELFETVSYLWCKSKSDIFNTIQASLRKDILTCTGEFRIDERKYLLNRANRKTPAAVKR